MNRADHDFSSAFFRVHKESLEAALFVVRQTNLKQIIWKIKIFKKIIATIES